MGIAVVVPPGPPPADGAAPSAAAVNHMMGAHVVSITVTAGFVAVIALLAFHTVQDTPLMNTMVGVLGAKFSTVVDFYLGSSISAVSKLISGGGNSASQPS